MESTIRYAKSFIKNKKVVQVSENIFEIEEYTVSIIKRRGARLISCSCQNHARNCNSPAFCVHKEAVIIFLANKDFLSRLDKLILEYQNYKDLNMQVSMDCFIGDLNSIKEKW